MPSVAAKNCFLLRATAPWLVAGAIFFGCAPRNGAAPPTEEYEFGALAGGAASLADGRGKNYASEAREATAALLVRRPLVAAPWYFGVGFRAENYFFPGGVASLHRLQDYAAVVAVEYYAGDEIAASMTLRPGWYFGGQATTAAWDVPVELTSGVPITRDLDGVVGFSNARFYHHALPIFGLVWRAGPRLRFEAVYPEPAVVFTLDPKTAVRIGGELAGAGFLAEAAGRRNPVEYASYRIGVEFSGEWRRGIDFAVGAGYEAERSFDFFRSDGRLHDHGGAYVRFRLTFSRQK